MKTIFLYLGLKIGTHKFFPGDEFSISEELQDTQMERSPSWTDLIPIFGSHGSSQTGLFND